MTQHSTMAHHVADLRRQALIDEAIADRRGRPATVRTRQITRPIRWLVGRLAAAITRVLEDFEPIVGIPASAADRTGYVSVEDPQVATVRCADRNA